jgi:hypothetical protein
MALKQLKFTMQDNKIHLEGYPDAVALKLIEDPLSRDLRAISLHQVDLSFCQQALFAIPTLDKSRDTLLIEALLVSSIARFFKCFAPNRARKQLSAEKILKGQKGAMLVFNYFKNIRNKHIIHDENPYSQSFVGVALMKPESHYKVADIVSMVFNAFLVDDEHFTSFSHLVGFTLSWVTAKRDELHSLLGKNYEQIPYDELLALPDVKWTAPISAVVNITR